MDFVDAYFAVLEMRIGKKGGRLCLGNHLNFSAFSDSR
jgi:hypothetical protein